MDDLILVGLDVGTSKICTLVGRVENGDQLRILGVGIEPSKGIRKGAVVDLNAASSAIARSIEKAERTSGLEITAAQVSLSCAQTHSENNKGVVGISGRVIDDYDISRAMESARAITIPHNQEIIHVIQRSFTVDGQEGIRNPVGMHAFRLEVETHLISASRASVENLRQAVEGAGAEVTQFVITPIASAETALSDTARDMGSVVIDMGGGTTSMSIYIDGDIWHTSVIPVGGDHVTSDIAHGLRLPTEQAEDVKLEHGQASKNQVDEEESFNILPFGEQDVTQINRQDLAMIIEARLEETFLLVLQEIKRSGYDGLLPAGAILTGGASQLPGIKDVAGRVLGMPVQTAQPQALTGMTDQLKTPAYSASVGLLRWAMVMSAFSGRDVRRTRPGRGSQGISIDRIWAFLKSMGKRLLP